MALAACRECGKRISTEARSCIGCGAPNPTSRSKKTSKDTSTLTFVEKIKFYFNGQYSLAFSFWTVGVLIQILVSSPFLYFFITGVDDVSDFTAFIVISYALFLFIFNIGVVVGQWRSAGFYIQENKPPFWGYVVRVLNVLTILSLAIQLIKLFPG
jgi:hypothetical protein